MDCTGTQNIGTGDFSFTCQNIIAGATLDSLDKFWQLSVFAIAIGLGIIVFTILWTRS